MSTVPVEFDQSFVHRGYRLFYDVYGTGDQVVIYTHGLLLDSQVNRGIAEALAEQGNRVVLLDLLGHGRSDQPSHATQYRIDSYADQIIGLMDHLGLEQAVLGGISLGANASLFAAARYPDRVRGLVLEMPVLERAVPAAALIFAPMILLAHYARPVLRLTSGLCTRLPRTRFGPLNSVLEAASLAPETMAAVLHGVLVGPGRAHPGAAAWHHRADARVGPPQRSHPSVRRRGNSRRGSCHAARWCGRVHRWN